MKKITIILLAIVLLMFMASHASNDKEENKIINSVKKYCDIYGLEEELVIAIIIIESDWNTKAVRYEPALRNTQWYTNIINKTNKNIMFSSVGLMQILPGTAKSMGYKGSVSNLIRIDENIHWGCRYLYLGSFIHKNKKNLIAYYNRGFGNFNNKAYVEAVYKIYKKIGGKDGRL